MAFKVGQAVIFLKSVYEGHTEKQVITASTVVKSDRDQVRVVGETDPRYSAFVWPDLPECRELLQAGLDLAAERKRLETAHYVRTLELGNEMTRRGLK